MSAETCGPKFSLELLQKAQALTWTALDHFHTQINSGMHESEGKALIENILFDMGSSKRWHKSHVRFGKNTLKSFSEQSDGDPILQEDDIYFADIGPIFEGHEGDCGKTWVIGNDPKKIQCTIDAKAIFEEVASEWKQNATTGQMLYKFAEKKAEEKGWILSTRKAPGHRLCDFPHQIHHKGNLADFQFTPASGLWILEIQIEHPECLYGAFYEDLLSEP